MISIIRWPFTSFAPPNQKILATSLPADYRTWAMTFLFDEILKFLFHMIPKAFLKISHRDTFTTSYRSDQDYRRSQTTLFIYLFI